MYDREVGFKETRKFASEDTKQGGNNHQTPILNLVMPTGPLLMGFRARVSHRHYPCHAAVRTGHLQGDNGINAQGDSAARDPAHCRDQRAPPGYCTEVAVAPTSGASFMPNPERTMRFWRTLERPY